MTYIPAYSSHASYDPIARLAAYFKDRNALSPGSAIVIARIDWIALGMGTFNEDKILKLYTFVKKLSPDKYWIDVTEMDVYYKRQAELTKKLLIFLGILFVVLMVFGIFS